ncbi:activator of HSP90 ATPase [Tersicoccus solisilvae]|uniref:Activator of HSP90 ATPase n=1 Tax=Tersicoccus solisilvae TaxID=1882339 RepID=A0ABQ1NV16_9MICC|nr:SRPBCC family protein [Tersicoccus solisilvae]GGC85635.1 activator of HSP90 ATPase [Tersicoccus solisilvae]
MSNALTIEAPEGLPFIDSTREFDAPVPAVFRAHADPDLVRRWMGPRGYTMDVGAWDFRSGGSWSFVHRNPAGEEFRFRGTFHTVRQDRFAVQTFEYEGVPDVVSIESLTFEPLPAGPGGGSRTRLRIHAVYPSVEARDGMVASGMEGGMREGYEQLEELLRDQADG